MPATIRPAVLDDVPAIAHIYNEGMEDRLATFETTLRSPRDVELWLDDSIPTIVAEVDGEVSAFGHLSTYRERECYSTIREFSIYTARNARRNNLGFQVMQRLISEAGRAGVTKIIARIFVENEPSLALCDRLGFRRVGTYEKHGKLDGKWRDCAIVELLLNGEV